MADLLKAIFGSKRGNKSSDRNSQPGEKAEPQASSGLYSVFAAQGKEKKEDVKSKTTPFSQPWGGQPLKGKLKSTGR